MQITKPEHAVHKRFSAPEEPELRKPVPPHLRKTLMDVEFDEEDFSLMKRIFLDEDTTMAAIRIIKEAPPEIQILTIQLINLIEEVA